MLFAIMTKSTLILTGIVYIFVPISLVLLSFLIINSDSGNSTDTTKNIGIKRVIIDVDVGADDYVAVMMFLYADKIGEIKIEALVCSIGNSNIESTCRNLVRLLETAGRTDIPVYKGATQQLILTNDKLGYFHGIDGFGDLTYDSEPDLSIIRSEPAPLAIHDFVVNNPNEITLISLGALTNLGLTIKLFDDFIPNLKEAWIMGGNVYGKGNAHKNFTSSAEWNFYIDPEAAHIALESLPVIHLLPWETCHVRPSNITSAWRNNVLGSDTPLLALLKRAEENIRKGLPYWTPCDAYLAFCFLNSGTYTTRNSYGAVELGGWYARGQVVIDYQETEKVNVVIYENVDEIAFMDYMLEVGRNLK